MNVLFFVLFIGWLICRFFLYVYISIYILNISDLGKNQRHTYTHSMTWGLYLSDSLLISALKRMEWGVGLYTSLLISGLKRMERSLGFAREAWCVLSHFSSSYLSVYFSPHCHYHIFSLVSAGLIHHYLLELFLFNPFNHWHDLYWYMYNTNIIFLVSKHMQ